MIEKCLSFSAFSAARPSSSQSQPLPPTSGERPIACLRRACGPTISPGTDNRSALPPLAAARKAVESNKILCRSITPTPTPAKRERHRILYVRRLCSVANVGQSGTSNAVLARGETLPQANTAPWQ